MIVHPSRLERPDRNGVCFGPLAESERQALGDLAAEDQAPRHRSRLGCRRDEVTDASANDDVSPSLG